MKKRTIIIITTRDYPILHRDEFSYLDIPRVEKVMEKYVNLRDEECINRLRTRIEDESEIEAYPDIARRVLVWEHERASWCKDADYFENKILEEGFKLIKLHLKNENESDNAFYVYVGPCTNGQGELLFRREYTAAMLLTAIDDYDDKCDDCSIVLVVHDKDIVDEDGTGPVTLPVFDKCEIPPNIMAVLKVLKFQHEDEDIIWKTIIRPIRDKDFSEENCEALLRLIESFKDQDVKLSMYHAKDVVTKSYLEKVDKTLLIAHYPNLFPKETDK